MYFQSETSVFKFLRRNMNAAKVEIKPLHYESVKMLVQFVAVVVVT